MAMLAMLAFWGVAAAAWIAIDAVVPWDSKNHFYPMLRYIGTSLAQGELPLWNPYHFSGHPSVADPQSLLFTPTMVALAWAVPAPSMQAFDLFVFAHLLMPAMAALFLFRRRGWHPVGAVAAAMMIVLGGSAAARLQHTGMIISYSFFLPALLFLEIALARLSWKAALAFAVCAGLMALGRDQVAFLCCLAIAGYVATMALKAERPFTWTLRRLPLLAGAGLVILAMLAVPALLTMQFLEDSNRPTIAYGVAAMNSLPPSSLVTMLVPNIFGSLNHTYDYWGPMWDTVPEGTYTDRAVNYLFAGTLPMIVLLWQGLGRGRLFARELRFFTLFGIGALVYALGRYTPVFEHLFDIVPGVHLYRRPADATFHLNIALAIAAGYCLHRYILDALPASVAEGPSSAPSGHRAPRGQKGLAARLGWLGPAAAVLVPVALVVSGLVFSSRVDHLAPASMQAAIFVGIAALGLSLLVPQTGRQARVIAACLVVAATGGELVARNAASALNAEPAGRYAVYQTLSPGDYAGLNVLKRELDARHAQGERPRVEILGLGGAWQNASMVLGIEDTVGYNALRIADYEKAVGPGENAVELGLRQFPGTFRGYRCSLASLLGLEYLVLDRPADKLPRHFPRLVNATLLYSSDTMWIYRLAPAAPRAYVATRLKPVDIDEVLDEAELPEFDRGTEALIDKSDLPGLQRDYVTVDTSEDARAPASKVKILSYKRNAVSLDVETDRPGVLVLHDLYYPGWEVKVDDRAETVLRANLLFRGVEVPAGHHRVEFTFRPLSADNLLTAAAELVGRPEEETATR
jgi:hypothetical protein